MRNYSADSYQRLRSLYQQKFLREGWQPFHQPITNPDRFKLASSTIQHANHHKTSAHSKSTINNLCKNQEATKTLSLLYENEKYQNQHMPIICMYSEQSPKLFWLKDAKRKSFHTNRTVFTSEVRDRKWISESFCLRTKKHREKAHQLKQIKEEKNFSKKSAIIKMLEQLRSQNGKKTKRQPEQQVTLEGKNTIIHFSQKRDLSLVRKHKLKDCASKSITCRKKNIEKMQQFQREVKIQGWNVVQGQY